MFPIPSLYQLVTRARNAIRANLPGTDAWLWPNNVNPTAKVIGGMTSELFGFADDIQRQKFALTANGPDLDLHGAEINLSRFQPTRSTGNISIVVADSYDVAYGAIFQRSDGVQFVALAALSITGSGTITVPAQSVGTGSNTVTQAGTSLSISSGTTDVNGDAAAVAMVATGGMTGGTDVEQDGATFNPPPGTFRYRILFKKRNPPQGGAASDYVIWTQQANGNVTRVFVEPLWAGIGTVRVLPMMDNLYANGIPQSGDIAGITAFIQTVQPSAATVTVVAPTPVAVNAIITGLTPSNPTTQAAVIAELQAAFLRLSQVAGIATPNASMPYLAIPFTFLQQWLQQAVDNAPGVTSGTVSVVAGLITAAGAISTSSATVTMPNVSGYPWVVPGMNVYDITAGKQIGTVLTYTGTTLTLTANAANAGAGSTDSLAFSASPGNTSLTAGQIAVLGTVTF
jgi:uncharacterized phage protein gp47/JayE